MKQTLNIFDYENYRGYLKDYYSAQKKLSPSFSHRSFAKRAGLQAPNYLKLVMDGKRPITEKNLPQFVKGLRLKGDEAKYFKALAELSWASQLEEKAKILLKLHSLRKAQLRNAMEQSHYDLFSNWYAWAIRELVLLKDFEPTPEYIVRKFKNRIAISDAKICFDTLVEQGYLVKNGTWKQSQPMISTSDSTRSIYIRKVHQEMLQLGIDAVIHDPPEEREVNGLTVAVARDKLPLLKEKIREFRKELNALLTTEQHQAEEILQINILAYRLSGR